MGPETSKLRFTLISGLLHSHYFEKDPLLSKNQHETPLSRSCEVVQSQEINAVSKNNNHNHRWSAISIITIAPIQAAKVGF